MFPFRKNTLRLSSTLFNILRQESSKASNPDNVSWSVGGKQKPPARFWEDDELWYKEDKFMVNLNPSEPQHQYPYKREDGGIQHFRFVYYPRTEDEKDPAFEPTPLLLVIRIKRLKHTTYWEKKICEKLGIDRHRGGATTVVKNIPEMLCKLWHIKHLVKIVPLRFPKDAPKDGNPLHYHIQDLICPFVIHVKKMVKCFIGPTQNLKDSDLELVQDEKTMDKEWICEQTRKIYNFSRKLEF
ncbi:39S ribosomal protein L30, mitochondrial [Armadillidium nasatum]|uniref:39S ribosomal protein L30, mitochondrial n=1 Tax=Armadillidium nasatum TaxID=96803 RepID=A0A5N5THI3_9CRUS|nr:39S ribosomal protein L30, mitochondrial [Armadillidium nasatum]